MVLLIRNGVVMVVGHLVCPALQDSSGHCTLHGASWHW
jgi:hypothetical protein